MLQQINLYRDILNKEERPLAQQALVLAFLLGLVLLLLISGLLLWQSASLQRQLSTLQGEETGLEARLAELKIQYPPKVKSQLLEERVANIVLARDSMEPLLRLLEIESQKNTIGFSAILESLSRKNPAGVWLRRVGIAAGGQQLSLEGSTQDSQLAPRYLRQLGQEPTLAGIEFERLQMDRSLDDPATIDFTLQTTVEVKK